MIFSNTWVLDPSANACDAAEPARAGIPGNLFGRIARATNRLSA
jgi:hypothetical protein